MQAVGSAGVRKRRCIARTATSKHKWGRAGQLSLSTMRNKWIVDRLNHGREEHGTKSTRSALSGLHRATAIPGASIDAELMIRMRLVGLSAIAKTKLV